jgi:hypothetical protein
MAAPNIINATTITGKTTGLSLTTTATTTVLSNPLDSGKCLKVNTLNVANISISAVLITVTWNNRANVTGTNFAIVGNVSVPAGTTLNVIDKTSQYYLEENTSIGAITNTTSTLIVTCSYEDIS